MRTIKGPGLFLAQFIGTDAPFDSWNSITRWAADCGYIGVQVPTNDPRILDLDKAAGLARLVRGLGRAGRGERHRRHRAVDPSAGPAGGGASRL